MQTIHRTRLVLPPASPYTHGPPQYLLCASSGSPGRDSAVNVYFLKHLGASLREAAAHIATEELPQDICLLLRRLERLETRGRLGKAD